MDDRNDFDAWREARRREREERYEYRLNNRKSARDDYSGYNYKTDDDEPYVYVEAKPKKKKKAGKVILTGLMSVLLGLGGGYAGASLFYENNPIQKTVETQNVSINTTDEMGTVEAVAKKALPSVVGITTTGKVNTFFGEREVQGVGSGVIINSNGYILTNSHVVSDGNTSRIQVMLEDDKTVDAKLLWNDPYMLSLIHI